MKRSKREGNWIIIHFIFYFVLVISLVAYTYTSLYPQIKLIEEDKKMIWELYTSIELIEKEWLSFDQFKSLNNSADSNVVVSEILKNMTDLFYSENLTNKDFPSFDKFLASKSNELSWIDSKEQDSKISKILPSYSDNSVDFWEEFLTNYRFINYVESLIESFNFESSNSIGINKVTLIEDFATSKNIWDTLDSNIYFVPLKLSLSWTKAWIINFLYFIENVWNISIKDDDIIINDDYWFLSKNGQKMILEWDRYSSDYNIFEHQITDISKITMTEYLDSSYAPRWDDDFKKFIVTTQWNDKYDIIVDLMFYIKWEPAYKIEEFINWIIKNYYTAQWDVNKELKRTDLNGIERINLTKMNESLKSISKEITALKKELIKKENIEDTYKKALKYETIIEPILNKFKTK